VADNSTKDADGTKAGGGFAADSKTMGTELVNGLDLQWVKWAFKAIQAGDCRVEAGAEFTLYSDGATNWTSEISSGDSGDEWKCWFHIKDARGVELFVTDRYYFNISDKDHKHNWTDNRGPNATYASHFNEADKNNVICYC
jgi:Family of unknown function (DUF6294)